MTGTPGCARVDGLHRTADGVHLPSQICTEEKVFHSFQVGNRMEVHLPFQVCTEARVFHPSQVCSQVGVHIPSHGGQDQVQLLRALLVSTPPESINNQEQKGLSFNVDNFEALFKYW